MAEYIDRETTIEALREAIRAYPLSFYNGIEVAITAVSKRPAADVVSRAALLEYLDGILDCNDLVFEPDDFCKPEADCSTCRWRDTRDAIRRHVAVMGD